MMSGDLLPQRVLGGAWRPQHEQILAGIFQPLFVVGFERSGRLHSIHYIPAHVLQSAPQAFQPRAALSANARRAGWTGFVYDLTEVPAVGISKVFSKSHE